MEKTIELLKQDGTIDERCICAYFSNIINEVKFRVIYTESSVSVGTPYFPAGVLLSIKDDDVHVYESKPGVKLGYFGRISLSKWRTGAEKGNMNGTVFDFLIKKGDKNELVKLQGAYDKKACFKFFDYITDYSKANK